MEFLFSDRFKKDYKKLSADVKKILQGKLKMMEDNQFRPSLRTKKIQGKEEILECSINMAIRMTWQYHEGNIFLITIGE